MGFFLLLIVLVGAAIGGYVLCYNSIVNAAFKVDEGWSGITVQLKRRHALVPNIVDAARTAMSHEEGVLTKIIEARAAALEALATNNPDQVNQAESGLTAALGSFVAYTESNPELKATENLALLQTQLEETEDQIAAARRIYNGNVQAYNAKINSIPFDMIAKRKGFTERPMFSVDQAEMQAISADPSISALGLGQKTGEGS